MENTTTTTCNKTSILYQFYHILYCLKIKYKELNSVHTFIKFYYCPLVDNILSKFHCSCTVTIYALKIKWILIFTAVVENSLWLVFLHADISYHIKIPFMSVWWKDSRVLIVGHAQSQKSLSWSFDCEYIPCTYYMYLNLSWLP
jgi:hypothetical protein